MGWWLTLCLLCFFAGLAAPRLGLAGLPGRLVLWHRRLYRAWWTRECRRRGGRPPIAADLIALIRRMSAENPLWGAPRIHGELLKLGFSIAQSTVSKYMPPRRRLCHGGPVPTWAAFLRNHAADIAAIDMFSVPTLSFQRFYGVVILGLGRRRILHVEVTDHPTAQWLAQQITEAFPWDETPVWLVRDNDGAYGLRFRRRLRAMGIRERPITPYSPWQNGYVERLIGSIRRECLDHVIVLNADHLRCLLRAYADYYNTDRTHLGLGKDAPDFRPIEAEGEIVSQSVLGGLHHRYRREARK